MTSDGFGAVSRRSEITKNPALSIWVHEGYAVPPDLISFMEQTLGKECVVVIRWRPEKKEKAEGEL